MVGVQVPHSYIFLTLIIGSEELIRILRELGFQPLVTSGVSELRNALIYAIGCKNYERREVPLTLGISVAKRPTV
jgi:hypothetical protein